MCQTDASRTKAGQCDSGQAQPMQCVMIYGLTHEDMLIQKNTQTKQRTTKYKYQTIPNLYD